MAKEGKILKTNQYEFDLKKEKILSITTVVLIVHNWGLASETCCSAAATSPPSVTEEGYWVF